MLYTFATTTRVCHSQLGPKVKACKLELVSYGCRTVSLKVGIAWCAAIKYSVPSVISAMVKFGRKGSMTAAVVVKGLER